MRTVLLLLLLPVGCSDYSLEKAVEEGKAPQEETPDTASPGDVDGPDETEEPPTEACNGEDDDGDGAVDEGFDDTDGDGVADCVDVEECDGLDNDGDGAVDEDFGDTDSDGVADCMDVEECDGLDNDGDGAVDEDFDENGNGLPDCTEEEVYCTDFSSFSDWSYNGTGSWRIESDMLTEGRAGSYEAIAWTGDMGVSDRFSIEVDIGWTGSLNDFAGIAWAVSGTDAFVVRWDDPQGDYGRYTPTGAVDIAFCSAGVCTPYAVESATDLYRPADQSMSLLQVAVDGSRVEVSVDGTSVLVADVPEVDGAGPGVVGVYSDDNDGGVWFDNYCVWVDGA
jgi:hypothetical protein